MKLKSDRVSRRMFRVSQTRLFTHYLPRAPALRRSRDRREQSHVVTPRYRHRSWEFIFAVYFFFVVSKNKIFFLFSKTHFLRRAETGTLTPDASDRRAVMCKLKPGFLSLTTTHFTLSWTLCGDTQGTRSGERRSELKRLWKSTLPTFPNRRQLGRGKKRGLDVIK